MDLHLDIFICFSHLFQHIPDHNYHGVLAGAWVGGSLEDATREVCAGESRAFRLGRPDAASCDRLMARDGNWGGRTSSSLAELYLSNPKEVLPKSNRWMDVAANWQALLVSTSLHPYGLCMHLSTFFHVALFENGRFLPLQPFYCGKWWRPKAQWRHVLRPWCASERPAAPPSRGPSLTARQPLGQVPTSLRSCCFRPFGLMI